MKAFLWLLFIAGLVYVLVVSRSANTPAAAPHPIAAASATPAAASAATPARVISRLPNGQYVEHDATVSGMQSIGGGGGGKWHQHAGPSPANPLDQPGRR